DIIRIDHFRAFDTFWKIPASCPTAVEGEWIEAPGYEVIDTLLKEIPGLNLVAEDLGELRPEVLELKDHYHLKGMKVLVFSIDTKGKYARDTFHDVQNMIFYTGTHDNDTIMEWYGKMSCASRRKLRRFLKKNKACQGSVKDRILEYTVKNKAEYVIIPMADILGMGKEGHINVPGTIGSPNWEWHLPDFEKAEKELCKFGNMFMKNSLFSSTESVRMV
ncbi:MAG: 4-alpha-glucanotransferase, partial [Clostridia bacterium]|nr:4-alpha-glucanotransferase [Clostridia bacterium]MDY5554177.1 4-alpha-glucanotransferase [Blautia sp.]